MSVENTSKKHIIIKKKLDFIYTKYEGFGNYSCKYKNTKII